MATYTVHYPGTSVSDWSVRDHDLAIYEVMHWRARGVMAWIETE